MRALVSLLVVDDVSNDTMFRASWSQFAEHGHKQTHHKEYHTVCGGKTRSGVIRKCAKTTLQCFTVLSMTPLDSLQKDLMRFEKLAEY